MTSNTKMEYKFVRYPKTQQKALQAWNSADEYLLEQLNLLIKNKDSIAIYNDRFGFLTCQLNEFSPSVIINFASQKKAILQNLKANNLEAERINFLEPLDNSLQRLSLALLKIPKSMDLFRLQLEQIANALDEKGVVLCGFMTKYFTKQMLEIANDFFDDVEQTLAKKKSRVLILKKARKTSPLNIVREIDFQGHRFKQYFGVFSAKNIDYASQFFVDAWKINDSPKRVLDLASGNGFLAKMIRRQNEDCEIHLLDDDWLAVESSKMNFEEIDKKTYFHFNDSLENFEDNYFDLIVCNPPFHFEFENNIEVAINLFRQAKRTLKPNGSFQIVANRHLNYKTHLVKLFGAVELIERDKKFEIYDNRKP